VKSIAQQLSLDFRNDLNCKPSIAVRKLLNLFQRMEMTFEMPLKTTCKLVYNPIRIVRTQHFWL